MTERGRFVPCGGCDRPELCAVLKPETQPCCLTDHQLLERCWPWLIIPEFNLPGDLIRDVGRALGKLGRT